MEENSNEESNKMGQTIELFIRLGVVYMFWLQIQSQQLIFFYEKLE